VRRPRRRARLRESIFLHGDLQPGAGVLFARRLLCRHLQRLAGHNGLRYQRPPERRERKRRQLRPGLRTRTYDFCDANSAWACCTSTAPGYACPSGTRCASLEGGGFCCTTEQGCESNGGLCAGGRTCCNGLVCTDGWCRTPEFQCIPGGSACVLGSTECCGKLRCMSLGEGFRCLEPTPQQQQ